ncbi:uncharacterized protein CLAFUR5_05297 [Fulvia fulva]|uniref:Uncharacterized protein n=1 Tax=Passalora fulva TaxID=5499 RepID=A0A9Q8LEC8_PASFU|nr:uncharacterized protein CLAFUR5_05297 [Fulvia fulva]KAK4617189.1 hypothetical protein CLAFUR0_10555 [Fulvia fulva]UJO15858.1 hypothetical protein CLAFUR5_05297 [Fulvia fulva]
MSDQYPSAKLVTDEIFNRITRESVRLHRRKQEMQQTEEAMVRQEGAVRKQVANLEQVEKDLNGKSAEFLSLEAATSDDMRVLDQRERDVAAREMALERREDEFEKLEQESKKAKRELRHTICSYNTQLDAYEDLQAKYQKTRVLAGKTEVENRLLKTQSDRNEKGMEKVTSQLEEQREKNNDLLERNAVLTEQTAYYKKELQRYRSSPLPGASPILSAASTTKGNPATYKPTGPLPTRPLYAESTVSSRARNSVSPPAISPFQSSSDMKIRGSRHDGLSTSFETASPAIRIPSKAASEIGDPFSGSVGGLDDRDGSRSVSGISERHDSRGKLRRQQARPFKKRDSYVDTPMAAAARDKYLAGQALLKTSPSTASFKSSKSAQNQKFTTPKQNGSASALSIIETSTNKNGYAFSAGSPPLSDNASTAKAILRKRPLSQAGIFAECPYQNPTAEDEADSSDLLNDTSIWENIDIQDLDLDDRQTARQSTGPTATKIQPPKLGSPIDIPKMTRDKMASKMEEKKERQSKGVDQMVKNKSESLGQKWDGDKIPIKLKAFL